MARREELTRAERRRRVAEVAAAGVYGVDVTDAGADSWLGRYLCWAQTPDDARRRVREAGLRAGQVQARWTPQHPPRNGLPAGLSPGDERWWRSRLDDRGWTPWEQLPATHRHPPQGRAATDPSLW